jgi:hypothetical protein
LQVGERVVVLVEQLGDLVVECGDALVEVLDVAGQFADAARGDLVGEAVTEADPLEPAQFALAVAAQRTGFADGVLLGPVGAQPLDRLGAVADKAAAL